MNKLRLLKWSEADYSEFRCWIGNKNLRSVHGIEFEDPLEFKLPAAVMAPLSNRCSIREKRALVEARAGDDRRTDLQPLIADLHQAAIIPSGQLRTTELFTNFDADGRCIEFPAAPEIGGLLAKLGDAIRYSAPKDPWRTAIVAYVVLLAIHPLSDGNGRLSRIYFNNILRQFANCEFYLPIVEFRRSFLAATSLAMRRAQRLYDWSQTFQMFDAIGRSSLAFESAVKATVPD